VVLAGAGRADPYSIVSVAVHQLTHRAKLALVELHQEFKKRIGFAQFALAVPPGYYKHLSDEYERRVKEIIREGTEETTPDRTVRVQCPRCGREEQIAGDVERWTCVCGSVERMAFLTYKD
jgi:ribosomal protein S27AE